MKNRKYMFLFLMIFMFVFSFSAVSADDFNTTESGTVSGDVDVVTSNPMTTSGELEYDIPSEAKEIKSAKVYVNIYSGSASNNYGANANVTLKTKDKEKQIGNESLWIEEGSTDGTVYRVNNHTNKCYSDYQIYYDITDSLKGLEGTPISIKVNTYEMINKSFDGRIKLIALTLAYNDGDDDKISYWINSAQYWTKTTMTTQFNTAEIKYINNASLTNIALSSGDGSYKINGNPIGDAEIHISGNTYQYNYWDVSDILIKGQNTILNSSYAGTSAYGSLKNVLSVLKIENEDIKPLVNVSSIKTEYTNTCYAGTNNTLTITVNSTKKGNYIIELLANGTVVSTGKLSLDGEKESPILLTDPTIRPSDETTVKGANNNKVNYTVNVKRNNEILANSSISVPVLYNGNLGKDLAYNATYMENFKTITITGDIGIAIQNVSTYLGASALNRTDIWNINLDNDAKITNAFVYISYNWADPKVNGSLLNITFNGKTVDYTSHYRDQSNLGNYGQYSYGLFIYDVSNLIQNGNNTLILNKRESVAIYPSTLIYLYNKTNSNILKTVYIANGADLLSNSNNKADRIVNSTYTLNTNLKDLNDAKLYVFASSAQAGEGNIIFNSEEDVDVWNGTSSTTDIYSKDITKTIKDSNKISFVATGGTILALQQIIVTTTNKTKPTPVTPPSNNTNKTNNTTPTTTPSTQTTKTTTSKTKVTLTTAKTTTVSKKAKKLVLSTKLKVNKKISKGKKVTFIVNGKKYKVKTNKKGVAKLTIKKSDLKKILKKSKVGKKIKYQIVYGKQKITRYIKIKK